MVRIGDVSEQIRGVTYGKADATSKSTPGYLPILRAGNIGESGITFDDLVYVPSAKVAERQLIRQGDVLIAASSGSLSAVGKAAQAAEDFAGAFGAFCKVLRPCERVDARYFGHFFRTASYRRHVANVAAGANINNLRNEHLDGLILRLPSFMEQKRIAAVLDQVDTVRAKRREAIVLLDDLARSIYFNMFGNLVEVAEKVPLSSVANIASGITKGRKEPIGELQNVPYLAVVNVQDRKLNLSTVKEISVSVAELERFRLQSEDLLLTEGGDPDKLGRGTLWRGELPVCIHQNHLFRVRVMDREDVDPVYLNWVISSNYGKNYFLRTAKQTTGIASINKSQLGAFPLPMPPLVQQREFRARIERVEAHQQAHRIHLAALDELFTSLQRRAFSGTLWESEAPSDAA